MANRFEIFGIEYPVPEGFKLGDPVLIEEVTGLKLGEFTDRGDDPTDMVVMLGLVAWSVAHANPQWHRTRVARFVEGLRLEDVKFVADEVEADASPPVNGSSPKDEGSISRSSKPLDSSLDTTPLSTTPDGLPPTIPVSA